MCSHAFKKMQVGGALIKVQEVFSTFISIVK